MANESAKRLMAKNAATLQKYVYVILGVNALYVLFRVYYLWDSFSRWHMGAYAAILLAYLALYSFLKLSATPKYAPLAQGGGLVSAGSDLEQKGLIEYTWDLLYVTIFLQLSTGFLSDWFWLFSLVPPTIGVYYLWTMIIYPWISKPDPEPMHGEQQQKGGKRPKKAR